MRRPRQGFCPLMGLGLGVSGSPWAQAGMEGRHAEELQEGPAFIKPTWGKRMERCGFEETVSREGTARLSEALILAGTEESEAHECGTQSLKVTYPATTSSSSMGRFYQ